MQCHSPQKNKRIPENVNTLTKGEAANLYLELGYVVRKAEGKLPVGKAWQNTSLTTPEEIQQTFRGTNGSCNVGIAPQNGSIIVDLDAKHDQGKSVRKALEACPELAALPREWSPNGVHIHCRCPDSPAFKKANGRPWSDKLKWSYGEGVSVEMSFSQAHPTVAAPSLHPDGHQYRWEVTGDIPTIAWKELHALLRLGNKVNLDGTIIETEKRPVGRPSKNKNWWTHYEGDLSTLDLKTLFEDAGLYGKSVDADEDKHAVECPWSDEHSDPQDATRGDSSTVIWQPEDDWPGFHCSHSHCSERGLEQALAWFERKTPGAIDAHCKRSWVYKRDDLSEDGRPQIALPVTSKDKGKEASTFAAEVGAVLGSKDHWFLYQLEIVKVVEEPVLNAEQNAEVAERVRFRTVTGVRAITSLEKFIQPGILVPVETPTGKVKERFLAKSIRAELGNAILEADQLRDQLPVIRRILDIPLIIKTKDGHDLPKERYDARFLTNLSPTAPKLRELPLEEAFKWINAALVGFCWAGPQSRVVALARMLSPFARGIMGFSARFPLWMFLANRERSGKDYLNGVSQILYTGAAFEGSPLSRDSDENRKNITAAIVAGRRMMNFANCQNHLDCPAFTSAITGKMFQARMLGSTAAEASLLLPNEIEFSLSGNQGITYRPDIAERARIIRLAYYQEDANSRTFPNPNLHRWVTEHRSDILSAIYTLYLHWIRAGAPPGKTPFASFPEWAEVVGGVMAYHQLGDPCTRDDDATAAVPETVAAKCMYRVCYEQKPETELKRTEIVAVLAGAQEDNGELLWFGDLDEPKGKRRVGDTLAKFKSRILDGITLVQTKDDRHNDRQRFMFTRKTGENGTEADADPQNGSKKWVDGSTWVDLQGCSFEHPKIIPNDKSLEKENNYLESQDIQVGKSTHFYPSTQRTNVPVTFGADQRVEALSVPDAPIGLDLETYGDRKSDALNAYRGDIRLLTVTLPGQEPESFDLKSLGYDAADWGALVRNREVIGHNLRFDSTWLLEKLSIRIPRPFCTWSAAKVLSNGDLTARNDLGAVLDRALGVKLPKDQGTTDWGSLVLTEGQLHYARDDVRHLHALRHKLEAELQSAGLWETFALEMALLPAVVDMQAAGMPVDREKLERVIDQATRKAKAHEGDLKKHLGAWINFDSPDQLQEAFAAVGVELENTDADTLKTCTHPAAGLLLAYRAAEMERRQAESLRDAVSVDGRIHAEFKPLGTATGRFSSANPNLQNIARGPLRECFAPGNPDTVLIVSDYSQIELRAAAWFSKDAAMLEAFQQGKDLHTLTAAAVLNKPVTEVTKADRQLAKAVNFGLLYGQSAAGLVRYAKTSYGVELTEESAARIRREFFKHYRGLANWHKAAWEKVSETKEGRTVIGRRRLLGEAASDWDRFQAQVNYVVQGSCADGLKHALVDLASQLPREARLIGTIHDEVVVESPRVLSDRVLALTQEAMKQAFSKLFMGLPVDVEAKVCGSWGEK
jgi:DNA polymerase I